MYAPGSTKLLFTELTPLEPPTCPPDQLLAWGGGSTLWSGSSPFGRSGPLSFRLARRLVRNSGLHDRERGKQTNAGNQSSVHDTPPFMSEIPHKRSVT